MAKPLPIGQPSGWTPERERDHFMLCPVSGEMLDMRRLDQALAHWHDGPEPQAGGCYPGQSRSRRAFTRADEPQPARLAMKQFLPMVTNLLRS